MAKFSVILAFVLVAIVIAEDIMKPPLSHQNVLNKEITRQKRSYLAYRFADGVDTVVSDIRETFSCQNRDYGYYADIGNNCQIFHVCVPPEQQFSFFCPNTTIFDQRLLICQDQYVATPCPDAERFYVLNQNFGVIDNEKLVRV